ncbi:MAG: WD40 repeat domain-containing protein [Cyanobacteria bacterium P01_G01_bin.49]
MNVKQFHWLEIVEFLALGLGIISLLMAIASGNVLLPLMFITLGLLTNTLNRLRGQYLQRKGLVISKQQLQRQLTQQIQGLSPQISLSQSESLYSSTDKDSRAIAQLQENLVSIEQSLNTVLTYLNTEVLPERIEKLEKAHLRLSQEINNIVESLEITANQAVLEITPRNPSPLDLLETSSKLPIVSPTTEVSPSVIIPEWQCLYTLTEHQNAVASLSISSDSQWLTSGSWDQTLRLWNLNKGTLESEVTAHSQGLLAVTFLPDEEKGYHIATGSFDQTIKFWLVDQDDPQAITLTLRETLTNHTGSVHALALSLNPLLLVSGSYDQTVKQWTLPFGEMSCSSYDPLGAIYALAVDRSQGIIASAGGDGGVTLWQLGSGKKIGFLAGNLSSVESLAISKNGQTLAAGCVDGTIKIWQLETSQLVTGHPLQLVRVLKAHNGQVKALIFSEQEQILFSGGADGYLHIWHPSCQEAIATLMIDDSSQVRRRGIISLTFDETRQLLIAGSADGVIKVWQKVMSD